MCCCHCHLGFVSCWMWCLLAIWRVDGMMVLALSAIILQGIFSILSPCQWIPHLRELHTCLCLRRQLSPYLVQACQCQHFEPGSKVQSVKIALTIFAHRGWSSCSLIGAHCYIVIFCWERVVVKQFSDRRKKFKAFTLIRHTWLETFLPLTVKVSNVCLKKWCILLSVNNAWVQTLLKVKSGTLWGECGVLGFLIMDN